jgi:hypothetical protein
MGRGQRQALASFLYSPRSSEALPHLEDSEDEQELGLSTKELLEHAIKNNGLTKSQMEVRDNDELNFLLIVYELKFRQPDYKILSISTLSEWFTEMTRSSSNHRYLHVIHAIKDTDEYVSLKESSAAIKIIGEITMPLTKLKHLRKANGPKFIFIDGVAFSWLGALKHLEERLGVKFG